jgi:DNA modification methylase
MRQIPDGTIDAVICDLPYGTTAIACIKEHRHFIGFELSKEYFDKAVKRIKAEQAQPTLW